MAKKDVTIFKSETASKILAKLGKGGGGSGGGGVTRGQPLSGRRPAAINPQSAQQHLIQIVEEHEDKEGYYTVEFVNRNITETDPEDHEWYASGQAESLIGLEMSGTSGLKADDKNKKAFMAFPTVAEDSNGVTSIIWVFSVGGSYEKPWVEITTVDSPSEYTGNVLEYPGGPVKEDGEGVLIKVFGATANSYEEGYAAFAEKNTDDSGEDVYYLDGYLLG